jgi:hypothetical protein
MAPAGSRCLAVVVDDFDVVPVGVEYERGLELQTRVDGERKPTCKPWRELEGRGMTVIVKGGIRERLLLGGA